MFVSSAFSQSRYFWVAITGAFLSQYALADAAGRVNFVVGEAVAISSDNTSRPLYKGDLVNSGDRIETGAKGRIQIRMTDGGFLALRPNSIFQVEKYSFSRDVPDQGSLVFKFLKGSMRTISGAIGKVNRVSYQLNTPVATIGIRGTDYAGTLNNDVLTVTVNQGQINLANALGSVDIPEGQTYEARADQAPTPSNGTVDQDNFETEEEQTPETKRVNSAAKIVSPVVVSAAETEPVEVPRPRLENYASYNQFLQAMYAYKKYEEEKNSPKLSVNGAPTGTTNPELSEFTPAGGTGDIVDGGEALTTAQTNNGDGSTSFVQKVLSLSSFNNFPLKAVEGQDLRQSAIEDTLNTSFDFDIAMIDVDQALRDSLANSDYSNTNQQFHNLDKMYQRFFSRVSGSKFFGNTIQLYMENEQFNGIEVTVIQRLGDTEKQLQLERR